MDLRNLGESILYKMQLRKPLMLLFVAMLCQSTSALAIVNMGDLHFADNAPGVKGSLSLGFSGSSGNSDKSQVSFDAAGRWQKTNYANMLIGNYQYGEVKNVRNTNSAFLHLRHIHKIRDPDRDWEAFTQVERNEFTRLRLRSLAGGGLRYSFFNQKQELNNILGVGAFISREELDIVSGLMEDAKKNVLRGNLYWLSRIQVSQSTRFYSTLYYQPALDQKDDFRLLAIFSFNVAIEKNLDVKLLVDVTDDNQPPLGVKRTDVKYLTGVEYRF